MERAYILTRVQHKLMQDTTIRDSLRVTYGTQF